MRRCRVSTPTRQAARLLAGGGRRLASFDRMELISDALTAVLACAAGCTIITEDVDFDLLAQLLPGLRVLYYDRQAGDRTRGPGA